MGLIKDLQEQLDLATESIEAAMRIKELWLPNCQSCEHNGEQECEHGDECAALDMMNSNFSQFLATQRKKFEPVNPANVWRHTKEGRQLFPPVTQAPPIAHYDRLKIMREAWDGYKAFLKKKYPAEDGKEWEFTCEHHKTIDAVLDDGKNNNE